MEGGASVSEGDDAPRAFVSHATVDQDRFVRAFATGLRSNGIDAWYAEWGLAGGDSLVERIFDTAIQDADTFIVVLTEASVKSDWVRAELNVGVVRAITKKCRLIPIVLDGVEVPTALVDTKWIRVDDPADIAGAVDEVLRAVFNRPAAPPLGAPPAYSLSRPPAGLVQTDAVVFEVIAQLIVERGSLGLDGSAIHARCETRGLTNAAIVEGVHALDGKGWIKDAMAHGARLSHLMARLSLLQRYLELTRNDLAAVRRSLIAQIVNSNERSIGLADLALQAGVAPIEAEAILYSLELRKLIGIHRTFGGTSVTQDSPLLARELG